MAVFDNYQVKIYYKINVILKMIYLQALLQNMKASWNISL